MEALISHNEAPISTWLPREYEENLTYGQKNVNWSEWTKTLKDEIKKDSIEKIKKSYDIRRTEMKKRFNIQVNPYLEFMNSILLTGRYNEITAPYIGYGLMTEDKNAYTDTIKEFFRPYQSEPIYRMTESMITCGFTFSRPVELMLCLDNSENFEIRFPLSQFCIQCCGGPERIKALLDEIKSFYKKTNYFKFFKSVKSFYNPILKKVSESLSAYPFINIIEDEFGSIQNSYNYVLSSLMNGNFGINFVDDKTKKADLFSVFTTNDYSLSPGILFHEYSHPFINPLTDKYYELAQKYSDAYEKLKKYKLPDFHSGYGDFKECINEHFVRAMAINLLKKINLTEMAEQHLREDLYCGYKFIPAILDLYDRYDADRTAFPDFDSFYPELLKVFNQDI
jgi:hypothetical protein